MDECNAISRPLLPLSFYSRTIPQLMLRKRNDHKDATCEAWGHESKMDQATWKHTGAHCGKVIRCSKGALFPVPCAFVCYLKSGLWAREVNNHQGFVGNPIPDEQRRRPPLHRRPPASKLTKYTAEHSPTLLRFLNKTMNFKP